MRKARYDLDASELKPYLQLEKLREGMFWVAGQLFGLQFTALPPGKVPVYHPDVSVWEVTRGGKHLGLWYFDPYARPGKRSGAWMNAYRNQERFAGEVTTIVSNNANFVKGRPGEPLLISWDDAITLFHEFGHALHGLSSNVNYPSLAGTSVARDYVEFPSQLLEHWLLVPEVLNRFAVHYQTGKPIPPELVAKIERAKTFNQGFGTVEYLSAALVDMKLHLAARPDKAIDPDAFERDTLAQLGMPREIVMRHRTPQFGHVFSSDGYSAGYYSYLWADTLTADAWEAFQEARPPRGPCAFFFLVLRHEPHRSADEPGVVARWPPPRLHDARAGVARAAEGEASGNAEGGEVGRPTEVHRPHGLPRRRRGLPAECLQPALHRGGRRWRRSCADER